MDNPCVGRYLTSGEGRSVDRAELAAERLAAGELRENTAPASLTGEGERWDARPVSALMASEEVEVESVGRCALDLPPAGAFPRERAASLS